MSFTCAHCEKVYKFKQSLKKHILKKQHVLVLEKENNVGVTNRASRILCSFESCDSNFNTISNYHHHLEKVHNVSLTKETLEFSSMQEFQNWKQNFEKETTSMFVQTSSAKKRKNCVTYYYFYCHRSFLGKTQYIRKTANKKKGIGSNKVSKSCPAMIKASTSGDGAVKVEFCSTHLGHETSVERLRLSTKDRTLLAEKLIAGIPPQRILADIRQNAKSPNDRIIYANMNDLYNIKKSFGIDSSLIQDQNDCISVESCVVEEYILPEYDLVQPEQVEIEKSRVLAKCSAILSDLEAGTWNSEQLSEMSMHLDRISDIISSVSKESNQPPI
ncbi:uncharacterized protein LOC135833375 [Planococcus citri]|uniref:uncharacterized protein LOC135833375 n=1 Tax=Planococcus citri TaxID=170843 RepID=UPI0031FA35F4